MRAATLLPLLLPACLLDLSTDSGTIAVDGGFSRVVVELTAGDLQLFGGDVDQVAVEWAAEYGTTRAEVEVQVEDGTLYLRGHCPDLGLRCHTDLYAVVPPEVTVEVVAFSGTLTLDGLSGADVALTTGDAYLRQLTGQVEVAVADGHVEGTHLYADRVVASSGTGRVDLELSAPFTLVDARTTTGTLSLTVPLGAYDLDLDSTTGAVEAVGVTPDSTAAGRIHARTTTGALVVTGLAGSF